MNAIDLIFSIIFFCYEQPLVALLIFGPFVIIISGILVLFKNLKKGAYLIASSVLFYIFLLFMGKLLSLVPSYSTFFGFNMKTLVEILVFALIILYIFGAFYLKEVLFKDD